MRNETIEYRDGNTLLEAYVTWDDSFHDPRPVVMIAHDWTGRRDFATEKAEVIAKMGYVGFALDMYGKGVFGADDDPAGNAALVNPLAENRIALRSRVNAAFETAVELEMVDGTRVGAIGYCFGGMCVLELARGGANVSGVISIHGILSSGNVPNENITAKVLCLHGQDDPMVPPEQVLAFQNEMTAADVDWQLHAYGRTMHAFTNPGANDPGFGAVYNPDADRRATQSVENFLAEVFA